MSNGLQGSPVYTFESSVKMPFPRKTGDASSLLNRKKNKTVAPGSPPYLKQSKTDDGDHSRRRHVKRPKATEKTRRGAPYARRVLSGHHQPSPKASPTRFGSDQFPFPSPVATPSSKTVIHHGSSVRSIRDYLSQSLWSSRKARTCFTPHTDSQPASPVGSLERQCTGFVKACTSDTRSSSRLSPVTIDACAGNSVGISFDDPWEAGEKLGEDTEEIVRCRSVVSPIPRRRRCPTPDVMTSNILYSPIADIDIEFESINDPPTQRWKEEFRDYDHMLKRCRFLETEVEYLRDREMEYREAICRLESEKSRLAEEVLHLRRSCQEAAIALKRSQEARMEWEQSLDRLQRSFNNKVDEVSQLKATMEKERVQWLQSMRNLRETLERERKRHQLYRTNSQSTTLFLDTDTGNTHVSSGGSYNVDVDISLNDFFEDESSGRGSNFRLGQSSSSVNNSPSISPRSLDDMRNENKRLQEENKRLREECEALKDCQRVCRQQQHLEKLKQEGNKSFQAGRYEEALSCYNEALEYVGDDLHMQAIFHCNKATAMFYMERFLGAIVSCCCAIDCDGSYLRAYQRRANAYEAISDYASAMHDLTHLIYSGGHSTVVREAQLHLEELQRMRRSKPVDAYKILGLSMTATSADIKKRYRKLALQFHPDKAMDQPGASEAFKLVSQAHSLLSDETKRQKFDAAWLRSGRSPSSTSKQCR